MKAVPVLLLLAFALPNAALAAGTSEPPKKEAKAKLPYSGNVKTLKFHKPDCKFYNCRDCTKFFKSPKEAIHEGYAECKACWK